MNINGTGNNTDYSRITGLATGMDTDGMVKQALAGELAKVNQAKQAQEYLQWQQEAYVGVIKDLKDFNDAFLDILAPADKNMMLSSSYTGTKASGDFGNFLEITTLAGAAKGNYDIKISQLAVGAKEVGTINSMNSEKITVIDDTLWNNKKLTFSTKDSNGVTLNVDIELYDVDVEEDLDTIVNKFNNKINGTVLEGKLVVSNDNGTIKFTSNSSENIKLESSENINFSSLVGTVLTNRTTSKLMDLNIATGNVKFTVDGKEFTTDATTGDMTINDFINKLRSAKNSNGEALSNYVSISYSELTKKITIENKSTGVNSSLKIEDINGGDAAKRLGLVTDGIVTGKNAVVDIKVPGETTPIRVERQGNNFTIDNIRYNLTSTTSDFLTVSVKADASDTVAKIKKFVEEYNKLTEKLKGKVDEKKQLNYKPLTADQKSSMKEEEIKKWEEQAKKGLLSRESNISNMLFKLREIMSTAVEGAGISLSDIGITTSSNWRDGGKLVVDDSKLKSALETRGDQVQKLFTQSSTITGDKGLIQRMRETFATNIGTDGLLIKKAGYENTRWVADNDFSKNIEKKSQQIKELERKMFSRQERYYKMFAALERNMNKLNAQSNWLATQLGG